MTICKYPFSQWGVEFVGYLQAPMKYLPADWQSRFELKGPEPEGDDCVQLEAFLAERNQRRAQIVAQAQSRAAAIAPVLAVLDLYKPPVKRRTLAMVFAVLDEVLAPTFIVKKQFARGRPWLCCPQKLDPMFRYTSLDPLHPAYPSGHSVQAHSAAQVLALMQPAQTQALFAAADDVAHNREVAGVHYPSDSAAGAQLAAELFKLLLASEQFQQDHVQPAQAEWQP